MNKKQKLKISEIKLKNLQITDDNDDDSYENDIILECVFDDCNNDVITNCESCSENCCSLHCKKCSKCPYFYCNECIYLCCCKEYLCLNCCILTVDDKIKCFTCLRKEDTKYCCYIVHPFEILDYYKFGRGNFQERLIKYRTILPCIEVIIV